MKQISLSIVVIMALIQTLGCGQNGTNGTNGTNGSSCTVTTITSPSAGSLISCTDGTQSLVLDGTVLTPVQFCSATTTYPSTFSEVGFCIDGSLYAVYSANDGFLTEVPNGTYDSDGINSSCSFTVTGCTVSH
jgi:hypothetical protein